VRFRDATGQDWMSTGRHRSDKAALRCDEQASRLYEKSLIPAFGGSAERFDLKRSGKTLIASG
jgi:hypothetical protein